LFNLQPVDLHFDKNFSIYEWLVSRQSTNSVGKCLSASNNL